VDKPPPVDKSADVDLREAELSGFLGTLDSGGRRPDAGPVRLFTRAHTDVDPRETGPAPTFVPWDFLGFGDPPRATVHLRWLTATAEEIVAEARRRHPELTVLDQR
jgi:hypothetical protein